MRLACNKIDRPPFASSPSVIHAILIWKAETGVVSVVRYLRKHHLVLRIHLKKPLQTPSCLIQNIGNTIAASIARRVVLIFKDGFVRLLHICKEHLIDGCCCGGLVLQVVCCIVPAACNIYLLAAAGRVVHNVAVVGVALCIVERVVAAPLLAHISKKVVAKALIYITPDAEEGRPCPSKLYVAIFLLSQWAKIQPESTL